MRCETAKCLRFVIFHAMMITDPQLYSVSYAQMLRWIDDIYDESDWKLMHYPPSSNFQLQNDATVFFQAFETLFGKLGKGILCISIPHMEFDINVITFWKN